MTCARVFAKTFLEESDPMLEIVSVKNTDERARMR